MRVLCDSNFFLLKHDVTQKIVALFGEMEREMKSQFPSYGITNEGLNVSAGKIFRGENYRKFPYILLDYPRQFSTETVLAFRSMFWWGHEFSFTLHLQGKAFEDYREKVFEGLDTVLGREVYYCVNDTPWQYMFTGENYRVIDFGVSREEFFGKNFCKLSRKIPVAEIESAAEYGYETFEMLFGLMSR
jgi:hypothetical protein